MLILSLLERKSKKNAWPACLRNRFATEIVVYCFYYLNFNVIVVRVHGTLKKIATIYINTQFRWFLILFTENLYDCKQKSAAFWCSFWFVIWYCVVACGLVFAPIDVEMPDKNRHTHTTRVWLHWMVIVWSAFWQVENKRRSKCWIVSAHQIAFWIIYASTNFCSILSFVRSYVHSCLSFDVHNILIFYFSLPAVAVSPFLPCSPPLSSYPLVLLSSHKLCALVHVSILSSTKALQAVANIVYFTALCQRWMLQAIVILFVHRFRSLLCKMFLYASSCKCKKKIFPTNFLRAFLCSV